MSAMTSFPDTRHIFDVIARYEKVRDSEFSFMYENQYYTVHSILKQLSLTFNPLIEIFAPSKL